MQPEDQSSKSRFMLLTNLASYMRIVVELCPAKEWVHLKNTLTSFFSDIDRLLPKGVRSNIWLFQNRYLFVSFVSSNNWHVRNALHILTRNN